MKPVTFDDMVRVALVIMALWGFYKIIMEIVKAINDRHDKEQRWDETSSKLKEDQEEMVCKYNEQLADIKREQQDIKTDFEGTGDPCRAVYSDRLYAGCIRWITSVELQWTGYRGYR